MQVFSSILEGLTERYSDFVYTFLGHLLSAIKKKEPEEGLKQELAEYLSKIAVPSMLKRNEKYCKVTEFLLKLSYRVLKTALPQGAASPLPGMLEPLFSLLSLYSVNPSILSPILKLLSLAVLIDQTLFSKVTTLLAEYSPMQHKEQVRIAVSKALARLLSFLNKEDDDALLL